MTRRKLTLLLAFPALLLAAVTGAWAWLLHSEPGARWLFARLQASPSFSLSATSVAGNIGSGLKLTDLRFENEAIRLEIAESEAAVNIDLLPPAVNVNRLHAGPVLIHALQQAADSPGEPLNIGQTIRSAALPIPVHVHDLDLNRIELLDDSGKALVSVEAITVKGNLYEALKVDDLAVHVLEHEITLSGQLGLAPPHPLDVQFSAVGGYPIGGRLDGNLDQLQFEIDSAVPGVRASGSLRQLLATPEWDVELTAPEIRWPLEASEPMAKLSDLSAHSRGRWSSWSLQLDAELELPGLQAGALALEGNGGSERFAARRIAFTGPDIALEAQTDIGWAGPLAVSVDAELERLDPGNWVDGWPEANPAAGTLLLEWSGEEISLPEFQLGVTGTDLSLSGSGLFDPASGTVEGWLNWTSLSWPVASPAPQFSSDEGKLEVTGSPEDWWISGTMDVQAAGFPQGRVNLSGAGDQESLELQLHEGQVLGGVLAGDASFNWTGSRAFRAALQARDIQTGALSEQLPGRLSADVTAGGQLDPLLVEVDLQRLDGTVRELPISGNGGFRFGEGSFDVNGLVLQSGESTLQVDGSPHGVAGMKLSAEFPNLSRFSDAISGSLSAAGQISLLPDAPSISGALEAQQLDFGSIRVDSIETRQNELVFSGLTFGNRPLESLILKFGSDEPLQSLQILARLEQRSIRMDFNGSVPDWTDPFGSGWKGQVSDFELSRERFSIALDQPAPLELSRQRISLSDACLTGSRNAKLCLQASWAYPDAIDFAADLTAIPLSVLELFLETDVRFDQVLSGTATWSQASGGNRSGNARIELSPGALRIEGDEGLVVETGAGLFGFEVANGRLQQGVLDFAFPQSGDIDVDFSADDLREGQGSQIQGTARVDLYDLGIIRKLFPVFDRSEGSLLMDLVLGGTISDPTFNGSASISNGRIENQASGFSFSEINLQGEVNRQDQAFLNGSFRAGEGQGEINTRILFEDLGAPEIDFSLSGDNLKVIDVPDLRVIAEPDLQLHWRDQTLTIGGRLYIPSTRLSPSYLPKASVRQSEDVVIVAGELPLEDPDARKESPIRLRGELEVELGDEVVVDLDVARIDVTGAARFNWRDELIPVTNGSFNGTGEIQAFGQFLRITRGRVSFPDAPADNPHLNIRAEREIFGNSQIRRAGLMVAGTLKRPVVEAYTVPMTTKERAQTLLVTGSDFNYEQGVGAVDVGMYVLPRLYISYGIGVFEDGNVLKVRYDLGRGFGIRATSGQRETGLDISYTIERE